MGLGSVLGVGAFMDPLQFLYFCHCHSSQQVRNQLPFQEFQKILSSHKNNPVCPPPSPHTIHLSQCLEKETGFKHQAGNVTRQHCFERYFLLSPRSPAFGWKQGNKQNINFTEKRNLRAWFRSQEKELETATHTSGRICKWRKRPNLSTHHVNPTLLSGRM